jgi:hypothetical protein
MYFKFLARDAVVIGVAVLVWWLVAERSLGSGMAADLSGFVAGLLVGVSAFVLHEWGHAVGGFATGSVLHVNHDLRSPFIFSFDTRRNTLSQFVIMSLGGFVATAVLVFSFYRWLPDGLLATRVACGAALFLAFLGVVLELPLFVFALASRSVPTVAAVKVETRSAERSRDALGIGAASRPM